MTEELEELKQIIIDSYENNLPIMNPDSVIELINKIAIQVQAKVSVKTADDLILYLEAKLIVDDDLLYGNKRNKEYFITGCYDNQEMIAQTSIKVYAKDFEEGTVVRIYLPNR